MVNTVVNVYVYTYIWHSMNSEPQQYSTLPEAFFVSLNQGYPTSEWVGVIGPLATHSTLVGPSAMPHCMGTPPLHHGASTPPLHCASAPAPWWMPSHHMVPAPSCPICCSMFPSPLSHGGCPSLLYHDGKPMPYRVPGHSKSSGCELLWLCCPALRGRGRQWELEEGAWRHYQQQL